MGRICLLPFLNGRESEEPSSVLPVLSGTIQETFVWYVMLFPVLLVLAFFLTLNFNHVVL